MAQEKETSLAPDHHALAERIIFDPDVLAAAVAFNVAGVRQIVVPRVGPGHRWVDVPDAGFCFDIPRDRAEYVMRKLSEAFGQKGYLFFLSAGGVPDPPATVAAIRGTDPYDVLRFLGTEDANGNRTTDDIIAILRDWEARYPFRITGAGYDWVEGRFHQVPNDMRAFAREVIRLAPDSYGQGGYDEEAFAADMRRAQSFHLWWD